MSVFSRPLRYLLALTAFAGSCLSAGGQVVISEIMYHPVAKPAFNANGTPVMDLYEDVHEFVEIHNAGTANVEIGGWQLKSGVSYTFPAGAVLAPGEYRVVAKDKVRLAAVAAYALNVDTLFGNYVGELSNSGETVRLADVNGNTVDEVSYLSTFPWAIGADGLGADDEWTGLNSIDYQYRGRSLERVSFSTGGNDPANWLASPLGGNPTPGRVNSVTRAAPKPVVISFRVNQSADEQPIIRANQQVRVEGVFSSSVELSNVRIEYFTDNIEVTNEQHFFLNATDLGNNQFAAFIPATVQVNRAVVRYRFLANRGTGEEVVSPRADDPFPWHAYFVTPVRTSANPIYDVFISNASWTILSNNINQSPRRVTAPDPPGNPREVPYVAPTAPQWNGTQPAIFVTDNVVRDVRFRHHGSRYRRSVGRQSYKVSFPEYNKHEDQDAVFLTDKDAMTVAGHGIFRAGGLPTSLTRSIDLYRNFDPRLVRIEQEEYDDRMLKRWHEEQFRANPAGGLQENGEFYKATGFSQFEGPYGRADGQLLSRLPYWTPLQCYEWSYGQQMHSWRGSTYLKTMIDGLNANRANVTNLKIWLQANWDIEKTLTDLALRNWMCPWDDHFHNYFLWQQRNGKWSLLPWDFDYDFGQNRPVTQTIYETNGNYFKDAFFQAFRNEYRQRLFFLNNTLLHPENISALGYSSVRSFADQRITSVNSQLGLGVFHRPSRPVHEAPANNASALPGSVLRASAYTHSAAPAPAHVSTTWRIRSATGNYLDPVYQVTSVSNLTSLPIPFEELVFGQRYFWQAIYNDATGRPSLASTETSFTFGLVAPGELVLNEVLADNASAVTNAGSNPDFVEIFNNGSQTVDLGGMSLSDDVLEPNKYVFPPNTLIPAQEYLVVWCDDDMTAPGLHSGFSLNNRGQTVALFAPGAGGGIEARDAVTFGHQLEDLSIGRIANGTGAWQLTGPTPGTANTATATALSAVNVKINEWMASPASGDDWFELYNPEALPVAVGDLYLTDQTTRTRIPPLSFVGPSGFLQFFADQHPENGADHVDFKLSAAGESISLLGTNGTTLINTVTFGAQTDGVSEGRLPDGAAPRVFFSTTPTPEASNYLPLPIVINEVLTHTDAPLEDAIELYNPSAGALNLTGWFLSDSSRNFKKYRLPSGSLDAGGYRVVYETAFNTAGDPNSFSLNSAHGDSVYLSAADAAGNLTGYRAFVKFDAAENGVSFGRYVTSVGATDFVALARRTFGSDTPSTLEEFRLGEGLPNASPKVGPVVVNEIMYHPPDINGLDNIRGEFIELHNITNAAVPLFDAANPTSTWRVRDAVSFNFPQGVTLPARGYLLVVSFDPADAAALANFRTTYNLASDVPVYGPYVGTLANGNDSVELVRPDPPQGPGPDEGFVPRILVEKVKYFDNTPWPAAPDGSGASLQRSVRSGYGNDPINWGAGAPTPGRNNLDSDNDGLPDAWEGLNGLNIQDPNDAALDLDGDGQTNEQEYASGTDPRNAQSLLALSISQEDASSNLLLRFTTMPNISYTLQYSDAVEYPMWFSLLHVNAEPGSRQIEVSVRTGSGARRFYRVITPQQP